MKILDLGEFYSERGGGVRSYLGALLDAAGVRGHEVVVLVPGPRDSDESVPGGRIIRYRAPKMPYDGSYHFPLRVDLMRRYVKMLRPDVLQLSSPYLPWLAASQLRVPVKSYVYHSDPIGAYVEPVAARWLPGALRRSVESAAWSWIRRVCHSCDVTVVSGEWLRSQLIAQRIAGVTCLPFGIEHDAFGPEHRSSELRAELLGPYRDQPEASLLLVGGRLALEKRQAALIRACGVLARSRPIAVVILGDGPERERLSRLAHEHLPVYRLLPFTRDRAEYARLLASADALVHGSACETYGFLLVEALASGTPIVAPNAGGAAYVADASAAELYPVNADAFDIAAAIGRVLSRSRTDTQQAALAAARRHPTKQRHFDALFERYAELLGQRRQSAA